MRRESPGRERLDGPAARPATTRGRGAAQVLLAALAVGTYFLMQAVLPDDVWDKAAPIAALGLGATLLGLAVDAARSVTGVGDPLSSTHLRHRQLVARVTDAEYDRTDAAIRDFVEDGRLTDAYDELFAEATRATTTGHLLEQGRALARARPRGRRPLAAAMTSGAILVGTATLVALTLLPERIAGTAALMTLAGGVYALQIPGFNAGSRPAVAAAGILGTILLHTELAGIVGLGVVPTAVHPTLLVPAGMLAVTAFTVLSIRGDASATWAETRRQLEDDTRRLRRRVIVAVSSGLVGLLAKGGVEGLFGAVDIDATPVTSSVVVVLWGVAAYALVELAGAHWALHSVRHRSSILRARRLDVHRQLVEAAVAGAAASGNPGTRTANPTPRTTS